MSIWIGVPVQVTHEVYKFVSNVDDTTFEYIGCPELNSVSGEYFLDYTLIQDEKLPTEFEFSDFADDYEYVSNSIENLQEVIVDNGFSSISEDTIVRIKHL